MKALVAQFHVIVRADFFDVVYFVGPRYTMLFNWRSLNVSNAIYSLSKKRLYTMNIPKHYWAIKELY